MAAGTRVTYTTTKHTYDIYDSVDNTGSIDNKALVPRYIVRVDGVPVANGMVPGTSPAGYIRFTRALHHLWKITRYYERR